MKFSDIEIRIIGCLIEKSITTPDHYPLSVNALTNACNQKSNRDPVLSLSEEQIEASLENLMQKRVVITQAGASSRVSKYQHRFCNTEFSDLQFNAEELAVICLLFVRGPQTPGEIRSRAGRLCKFDNVHQTETVLDQLAHHDKGPYVIRLPREPGRRECRYQHCFSDASCARELGPSEEMQATESTDSIAELNSPKLAVRIEHLVEQIDLMRLEIDELRERITRLE